MLDVGAGTAPYRELFAHCEYRSHDFAKLTPAEFGAGGYYGDLDYVSDVTAIPVPDASFDAVVCTEVLEHVPDPVAAIREIARIVRPGGRVILTAPQRSGGHQSPYHFYGGFTPSWYRWFLPAHGLRVTAVEPNGGFFRAYGEESQRFVTMLFPPERRAKRLLLLPLFIVLKLWALAVCAVCYALDGTDRTREFTVGYHVTAERLPTGEAPQAGPPGAARLSSQMK